MLLWFLSELFPRSPQRFRQGGRDAQVGRARIGALSASENERLINGPTDSFQWRMEGKLQWRSLGKLKTQQLNSAMNGLPYGVIGVG